MIFQHTIDLLLAGKKTQTRRIWKPKWTLFTNASNEGELFIPRGVTLYRTGHTYAAQRGRGKHSEARWLCTSLRHENLRDICDNDAYREGITVDETNPDLMPLPFWLPGIPDSRCNNPREAYFEAWDTFHSGDEMASANPVVLVIGMKLITP